MRLRPKPGRFFWKLFSGNVLLLALVLAVSVWLLLREFGRFHRLELRDHLRTQASTLCTILGDRLDAQNAAELDDLAKRLGTRATEGTRVTFVLADGTVVGDSEADVAKMESHADRVEIREALRNGWGYSTRWSHTVSRELLYVAVRVGPSDAPRGTVRVSMAVRRIGERTNSMRHLVWMIAGVVLLAAVALALGLARIWSLPLRRITVIARRLARGDMSARARFGGSDELAVLAQSLNQMRDHLGHQLSTIEGQRETLAVMLLQLQEGVIVSDGRGRIVMLNPQAARFLRLPEGPQGDVAGPFEGKPVEECVRNHDVQQMLLPRAARRGAVPATAQERDSVAHAVEEARIELPRENAPLSVLARSTNIVLPPIAGSPASFPGSENVGRLLVLTDISDLTKTIQMKTDFVANASHELRTPLSAIRASVETVMAMDLESEGGEAKRFIEMIDRHSGRLDAMVADLLNLSRLESAPESYEPGPLDVAAWVTRLSEQWAEPIAARNLTWNVGVDEQIRSIQISEQLLTLVVNNLLENAIKFTPSGGHVGIAIRREGSSVVVFVTDTGCGIPAEEQERVFERFYQVERSRGGGGSEVRGTGLGLSIARHAVAAMNGEMQLTSELGRGTTIRIHLPQG